MTELLAPRGVLELRAATLVEVRADKRLVTVIAVPYDEPAQVEHRGRRIREEFDPGAFVGIEKRPGRVIVNREHDYLRPVGRVVEFRHGKGLIAATKIAETPEGDETLEWARSGRLAASVGFAVDLAGQQITSTSRRVMRAWLDHLALVDQPAYAGARVLSVGES